jgi:hypothetical protein
MDETRGLLPCPRQTYCLPYKAMKAMEKVYFPVLVSPDNDGLIMAKFVFHNEKQAFSHAIDMQKAYKCKPENLTISWIPSVKELTVI